MCICIHRGKEREGIMKGGGVHGGVYHICTYIYIYIYVYAYSLIHMYIMHISGVYVCARMHNYVQLHVCVCVRVCVCVCVCVYVDIHMCMISFT